MRAPRVKTRSDYIFLLDHKTILSLYTEGFSAPEIARLFGCSTTPIYRILHNPFKKTYFEEGPKGFLDKNGYRLIRINGRQTFEHRLIMEEYIGRELEDHETVHHLNGQKADNIITNLELWSGKQPAGQRVRDKVKWAKEILALYGEDETQW